MSQDVADTTPADSPAGTVSRWRRTGALLTHALACVVVAGALLLPDRLEAVGAQTLLRVPVEVVTGGLVVLTLPTRAGRVLAPVFGFLLGLLAVGKMLDLGFMTVLARPFDPVLDWVLLDAAVEFLSASVGPERATATAVVAAVVAVVVPVLVAGALARLTRLTYRHRSVATLMLAGLAVAWLTCASLDVRVGAPGRVADHSTATLAVDRARQVHSGLRDRATFAAEVAEDAFEDSAADTLLTGLRGKDVIVAFVESYGRSALDDPAFAGRIGEVLGAGDRRLQAAGFSSRSAFLTAPTAGGGSWLSHATLLSGVWIDNEQRYRQLVSSDRLTLNEAFGRAGWRTVGVMPGVTRAWPEGALYGYDHVYDSRGLGYRGPRFSWAPMPDQYTLSAFQRLERARAERAPVMAEIALVSSHGPWVPVPRLIDWDVVGDGTAFEAMVVGGDRPDQVLKDPARLRGAYRDALAYSLDTLISYLEAYGDDDLVMVLLGDHQPTPVVIGENANRDVPVTVVARDQAVLDRIERWGWQSGLRPDPSAPVWRMSLFRDRFLGAFGPAQ